MVTKTKKHNRFSSRLNQLKRSNNLDYRSEKNSEQQKTAQETKGNQCNWSLRRREK